MKKKKLLIGYQGIVGSNSETAAQLLFKNIYNENKYECELVPLTTSAKVFEALFTDKIDLGVVATRNSTCGNVMESMEALKNGNLNLSVLLKFLFIIVFFLRMKMLRFALSLLIFRLFRNVRIILKENFRMQQR